MQASESEIERILRRVTLPDGISVDKPIYFSTQEGEPYQVEHTVRLLLDSFGLNQVPTQQVTFTAVKPSGATITMKHNVQMYDYIKDVQQADYMQLAF